MFRLTKICSATEARRVAPVLLLIWTNFLSFSSRTWAVQTKFQAWTKVCWVSILTWIFQCIWRCFKILNQRRLCYSLDKVPAHSTRQVWTLFLVSLQCHTSEATSADQWVMEVEVLQLLSISLLRRTRLNYSWVDLLSKHLSKTWSNTLVFSDALTTQLSCAIKKRSEEEDLGLFCCPSRMRKMRRI